MKTGLRWTVAGIALSACGKPVGLDTPVKPLQQIHVLVTGEVPLSTPVDAGTALDADLSVDADLSGTVVNAGVVPGQLHAALVWGLKWLPEPFCVLPPESPAVAAVIAAGCRDGFGFVPVREGADTVITPGVPAILNVYTLPAANVMVGDVTARIAYASVIIYEDSNGDGALDFRHPPRQRRRGEPISDAAGNADIVYGASFISMTLPDRRVAFREGAFNAAVAFYPRAGCADPPVGFSILSAGGFSQTTALLSALAGQLPPEDPSLCATATIDDTIVIPLQAPTGLSQLACTTNDGGGVTYYQQPQTSAPSPDLANALAAGVTSGVQSNGAAWACAGFPQLPGDSPRASHAQQLVISSAADAPCRQTLHYSLRGCESDPFCATGGVDVSADPNVLSWWPCSTSP